MRIIISGQSAAFDAVSGEQINDITVLRRLAGLMLPDADCATFLDDPRFDEIDLTGGSIRTEFEPTRGLRVVTEYRSPRGLSNDELAALATYTQCQWSDGAGENGLDVTVDDRNVSISFSPVAGELEVEAKQVNEDSPLLPRFHRLFTAVRRGDAVILRAAIEAGEDINCRKGGMSALQWAIIFGHVQAALLLIESGADITGTDVLGDTALVCCAASRDPSDEAAATIAEQLLRNDTTTDAAQQHGSRALEIALLRGKTQLAKLLNGAGGN